MDDETRLSLLARAREERERLIEERSAAMARLAILEKTVTRVEAAEKEKRKRWWILALSLGASNALLFAAPRILGWIQIRIGRLLEWTGEASWKAELAIILVAAFGVLLWFFRRWKRIWYAAFECGFALTLLRTGLTGRRVDGAVFSLLGGIYVLVRGVDNFAQGIREARDHVNVPVKGLEDEVAKLIAEEATFKLRHDEASERVEKLLAEMDKA